MFDGRRSREGYWLNMFCMSLRHEANREAFRADEAALPRPVPDDRRAARRRRCERDWIRMLELGGNIYYTFKLAACDGMTFQQLAAKQTGVSEEEYVGDDARRRTLDRGQPPRRRGERDEAGASRG